MTRRRRPSLCAPDSNTCSVSVTARTTQLDVTAPQRRGGIFARIYGFVRMCYKNENRDPLHAPRAIPRPDRAILFAYTAVDLRRGSCVDASPGPVDSTPLGSSISMAMDSTPRLSTLDSALWSLHSRAALDRSARQGMHKYLLPCGSAASCRLRAASGGRCATTVPNRNTTHQKLRIRLSLVSQHFPQSHRAHRPTCDHTTERSTAGSPSERKPP